MALQCNIDSRGKAVRLISGMVALLAGVGVTFVWTWVGIALIAVGAFAIFEGWRGWCAVRAMGFKTKV